MDNVLITAVLGDGWRKSQPPKSEDIRKLKRDDVYQSKCAGKIRHKTESLAMCQANRSKAYLEVYLCSFCGSFHVGSNRERHKITTKRRRNKKT